MAITGNVTVTTELLWKGTLVFALADLIFVSILVRIIKPDELIKMKWRLVIVMAFFFCALFGVVVSIMFWDSVYSYVFPTWFRWIVPPLYGSLFSIAGLLFWWISTRSGSFPVLLFCLFGGLWGVITHILAIQRGMLEKPPMLNGAGHAAALAIAAFEFIFYWCVCLSITRVLLLFKLRKKSGRGRNKSEETAYLTLEKFKIKSN
jgi:hypothetical protein